MKYVVSNFPEPSAKRMKENPKKLEIILSNGWGFCQSYEYFLPKEQTQFIFDVDKDFTPSYNETALDGNVFSVELTYSNTTNSRNETFILEPKREKK
jgi:hypothetical protein